ncbi:MAG: hypothetical protein J6M22_03025 [Firmicutes bacterium]|nr:hypothetical protein [Bacillota bacterium]
MRKKIVLIVVLVLALGVVSGVVFANSRVNFDAELLFSSATDDKVVLNVTNRGRQDLVISKTASYMDELGTAGSWDAAAEDDTVVRPGQSKYIRFHLEEAVAHGDHSVLAFYFLHDDYWFLCKTGVDYGTEIYKNHD